LDTRGLCPVTAMPSGKLSVFCEVEGFFFVVSVPFDWANVNISTLSTMFFYSRSFLQHIHLRNLDKHLIIHMILHRIELFYILFTVWQNCGFWGVRWRLLGVLAWIWGVFWDFEGYFYVFWWGINYLFTDNLWFLYNVTMLFLMVGS